MQIASNWTLTRVDFSLGVEEAIVLKLDQEIIWLVALILQKLNWSITISVNSVVKLQQWNHREKKTKGIVQKLMSLNSVLPLLQPELRQPSEWLVVDQTWFWPVSVQAGENTCTSPWSSGSWCNPCKQWRCYQWYQSWDCHWGEQSDNLSPPLHSCHAETHDKPDEEQNNKFNTRLDARNMNQPLLFWPWLTLQSNWCAYYQSRSLKQYYNFKKCSIAQLSLCYTMPDIIICTLLWVLQYILWQQTGSGQINHKAKIWITSTL